MSTNSDRNQSPTSWEDEFSHALKQTPSPDATTLSDRIPALSAVVRRRRGARLAAAGALSAVLVLGIGAVAWRAVDTLRRPDLPVAEFPVLPDLPTQPWIGAPNCAITLNQAASGSTEIDGHALVDFTVTGATGSAAQAVIAGPDSTAFDRDPGAMTDDLPGDSLWYQDGDLGTIWFPANQPTQGSATEDPVTLSDPTAAFGTFPAPAPNLLDLSRRAVQWTVSGGSADSTSCEAGAAGDPTDGTYVAIGYLPVVPSAAERTDAGFAADDFEFLFSEDATLVQVAGGTAQEVARMPLSALSGQDNAPVEPPLTDDDAAPASSKISMSDGRSVRFLSLNDRVSAAAAAREGTDFEPGEYAVSGLRLVSPLDDAGTRWVAIQWGEINAEHVEEFVGIWSQEAGFAPFDLGPYAATKELRRTITAVAVDPNDPAKIAWSSSLLYPGGTDPYWVLAADANTGEVQQLVGPDQLSDNEDGHAVALLDGRVYWTEKRHAGEYRYTRVVRSRSVTGGKTRLEAVNAANPTASTNGVYAASLSANAEEVEHVGLLEGGAIRPLIDLENTPSSPLVLRATPTMIAVGTSTDLLALPLDSELTEVPIWTYRFEHEYGVRYLEALPRSESLFWSDTFPAADDDSLDTTVVYATVPFESPSSTWEPGRTLSYQPDYEVAVPSYNGSLPGAWDLAGGPIAAVSIVDLAPSSIKIARWPAFSVDRW